MGNRLNGDHEPVDGLYPIRMWEEGDVIVDIQQLKVPLNYRSGTYTIYTGIYSGNSRMQVVDGPRDSENRVRVGELIVR